MKKAGLIALLGQLKIKADEEEINDINRIKIVDLLLDYINDPQIRAAVEEIPF